MYIMVQKSIFKPSIFKVFGVFVHDPLKIHYIKEIARKIKLAPTSVKKHLTDLEKQGLIIKKKGEIFFGFVANRDNNGFLFYKKIFNLINIKESKILDFLINSYYPKTIILYGSYFRGEDIKESDVGLIVLSKSKKRIDLSKFEVFLNRDIHLIVETNFKKLNKNLKNDVLNGLVLYGYLENAE